MYGCENFLCESAADFLQQIAVIVESTGFTLVVIEIWFPEAKIRVEQFCDQFVLHTRYARLMATYWKWISYDSASAMSDTEAFRFTIAFPFVGLLISTGCIFLALWFSAFPTNVLPESLLEYIVIRWIFGAIGIVLSFAAWLIAASSIFMVLLTIVIMLLGLIVTSVGRCIHMIDTIAKGHAFAGIGLLLAATGLCFEFYQVAVLWWS